VVYSTPKPSGLPPPANTLYQGRPAPPISRAQRQRFRWWYDNIIDWMLANPDKPLADCAKAVGRSADTIRTISNTDIFKSRLADRRTDMNLRMADALVELSSSVAMSSLREIQTRLRDNPAKIPLGSLSDIADKALNRLGYGVAPVVPPPQPTTVNVAIQVSPNALKEAQENMRRLQTINSTAVEESEPSHGRLTPTIDIQPSKISSN
jgi:hypothetical protein